MPVSKNSDVGFNDRRRHCSYAESDRKQYKIHLGRSQKKGKFLIGRKEKVLDNSVASVIRSIKPDNKKADFDRGLKITGGKAEILLSPENYLDMDIENLKMEIASSLFRATSLSRTPFNRAAGVPLSGLKIKAPR